MKISIAMLPLDSIPYKEGVGHMEETKYHWANVNDQSLLLNNYRSNISTKSGGTPATTYAHHNL
jgi:hypothetical protein